MKHIFIYILPVPSENLQPGTRQRGHGPRLGQQCYILRVPSARNDEYRGIYDPEELDFAHQKVVLALLRAFMQLIMLREAGIAEHHPESDHHRFPLQPYPSD